jgi:hypothetical protein
MAIIEPPEGGVGMSDITTELQGVHAKANAALQAVQGDGGASPVLTAVVNEFASKAEKALRASANGQGRDAVFELEQAGDSAKVAAEADGGAAEPTTSSVLDAHLAICMLKAEIG